MNNPLFLVAGYGVTFIAIAAYIFRLHRMEREVESEERRTRSATEVTETRA